MRQMIWAATALPLLGMPTHAQDASADPSASALGGLQTSTLGNLGQLFVGGSSVNGSGGGSSIGAGTSGTASSAGQLDFSRTNNTGGAPSGAGISAGSGSTSQTDDTYLYPLYGKHF